MENDNQNINAQQGANDAGTGTQGQQEQLLHNNNEPGQNGNNDVNLDELFKRDDVMKKVQSIADKRVTDALATAKTKWQAEQEAATDEAAKLAKMTADEKARYQFQKEKDAFAEMKAKFEHEQLVLETAKQMNAAGLPDLSQYVTGKTAEETAANIEAVTKILSAWKSAQLDNAMRGKTPENIDPNKNDNANDILARMKHAAGIN